MSLVLCYCIHYRILISCIKITFIFTLNTRTSPIIISPINFFIRSLKCIICFRTSITGKNLITTIPWLLSVRHYFTKTFNIIIRMHYTRMYETGRIVDFYLFIFPFIHSIYSIFNLAACTQCDSCEQSYC